MGIVDTSFANPGSNPDPPDPHVLRPSGSGSISQRHGSGSGSFYHAKIVNEENSRIGIQDPDPDPLVRGMDARIRIRIQIHIKMSWIRNTGHTVIVMSLDFRRTVESHCQGATGLQNQAQPYSQQQRQNT
jgi:hypothetical protein